MNIRIASAILVLLTIAVTVGLSALPEDAHYPAPANAVYIQTSEPDDAPDPEPCALILGVLICGAATIGLAFFTPRTPRGSRTSGTLSAVVLATTDFASTWGTRRARPEPSEALTAGPERCSRGSKPVRPEYPERRTTLFVERARRGLAHLHQELQVVLGLLQTVDQQIDRLVRVQAGQYAAQFVQYRRLVGAEQ